MAFNPENAPGGAELWKIDNILYLMYRAPRTDIPMLWRIPGPSSLRDLGIAGKKPSRTMKRSDVKRGLFFGLTDELRNMSDHPFNEFLSDYSRNVKSQPWLKNPEVLTLHLMAILEGRALTDAELKSTSYFRSRTEQQRSWMELRAADPQTADQRIRDNRHATRALFSEAGWSDAPWSIVNWLADQHTRGDLTEAQLAARVRSEIDPYAPQASPFAGHYMQPGWSVVTSKGKNYIRTPKGDWELTGPGQRARYVNPGGKQINVGSVRRTGAAADLFRTMDRETTRLGGEQEVKDLVAKWLGPLFSGGYSDRFYSDWAGKIRQNPNLEDELTEYLKKQRLVMFPEYENENLTYEDIAAPWRALVQQTWGEQVDESDPFFSQLIRLNDVHTATKVLRTEGMKRRNGTVGTQVLDAVAQSMGPQVRPSLVGRT